MKKTSIILIIFIGLTVFTGFFVLFGNREIMIENKSLGGAEVFQNLDYSENNQNENSNDQETKQQAREEENIQPPIYTEPGQERSVVSFEKVYPNNPDPQGQLVTHLYDILNAPGTKSAVFSPDGNELWTALLMNTKRGVSVYCLGSNTRTDIVLPDGGGVEIAFSLDGSKVYVSQMETARVFEIEAASKKILRTFETGSSWTKVVAISSDGKTLYASNWVGDDISQIDLETGKLIRKIPTVDAPRSVYPTRDNKHLYVAGFGLGQIQKIDLATGKGKIIFTSYGAMRHITADEERGLLYFSDMAKNAIYTLDMASDKVEKFALTDNNPNTIALSPDKKVLFVSCRGINYSSDNYYVPGPEWGTVLLFDAQTGKMLDAIIGGNQPTALDISPDGRVLVFSDFLDSRLEFFGIPDYNILAGGNGGRSLFYKNEIKK